jgi:hypothetical protein
MPSVTNKAYDVLLTTLEQLAEGTRKHADNAKVSACIDEEELRTLRAELESLRENYLQKEAQARMAYHAFEIKFKAAQQRSSNDIRIVKGLLGPKAEELRDFGIMPERSKASKKFEIRFNE